MVVAAVPRIYMGDARKWYSSHSPLLPSGKQLLRFHIAKRGKKDPQSSFFPRFLLFRPPPSRTWRIYQVSHCPPSRSTFPSDETDFSLRSKRQCKGNGKRNVRVTSHLLLVTSAPISLKYPSRGPHRGRLLSQTSGSRPCLRGRSGCRCISRRRGGCR